ncbi:potassium channel family protein [Blastococcus sp. URHD0036]|uniref:potassium channel family protein n=1 Tax=Blastococcus sp. URHD0036 TaxID=1380356 RepID=UPI00069151A1|nr:potassium channel family protein [Blastococcus sp. URHD0036]
MRGPSTGSPARRTVAGSLLRSAVTAAVLLVLYYAAPLDRPLDGLTGVLFLAALALFGVVMAVQLRGIMRSATPRLQAIRAVAVGLPMLWVVFAATYWIVDAEQVGAFTEPLDRTDGLYFTITVFSTVGFGDITPVSELARVLVTVQMLVGLVAVGVLAKLVLGAVKVAVARKDGEPVPAGLGEELPDAP